MFVWIWPVLVLGLAMNAGAKESETGRTDGAEGSEYGKGGYWRYGPEGRFYAEGFFGAATVDIENGTDSSRTDLVSGFNLGYMIEDWLAFQMGYGHIADQKTNLFSGGIRSAYNLEPFNYYFSLDAELYSPEGGEDRFGIVSGAGAEVILNDHLRVGLRFQHDFIFADEAISINRFTAKVQLDF